ncbi:MAG: universal stress protein [Opitutaceae bacterium]|nr:universal stress protein [Opitutaceae bacterium]
MKSTTTPNSAAKDGASARKQIPSFRRVLVTTDLSAFGNAAIAHAYSLLSAGGLVRVVHIEKPFEFANPAHAHHAPLVPRLAAQRKRQLQRCGEALQKLIPATAGDRDIATEIAVLHEDAPAAAICREADHFGADVVCMASHGRSGLVRTITGSVTQAVMARATCPLLVIFPKRRGRGA